MRKVDMMATPWLMLLILQTISIVGCKALSKRSFTIDDKNDQFIKDGKPFRYISCGIHYFRIPHQYWQDRLYKIKKSGCNAIQTYVPWNFHEPYKGKYKFSGDQDLVAFINLAQTNDLLVILRPGPYICAEWDYGGFPYWLMKEVHPSQLRTKSHVYMDIVGKWLSVLLTKMKPLLYSNGGPIITVQVENEYGSYGTDHVYMTELQSMFEKYLGHDVVLFTTDGAGDWFLKRGSIPTLFTTIDFGPGGDPKKYFKIQRKYQPHGPNVNSEYYTGWLDHWGSRHSRTSGKAVARSLDHILAINASVNMYMFIGGTNFGFWNGANYGKALEPQPTSYDYDAPLSEAGDPTDKYHLIQKVISKYNPIPPGPKPEATEKMAYGKVHANVAVPYSKIVQYMSNIKQSRKPLSFEELDSPYGYVIYATFVGHIFALAAQNTAKLVITKLHDRAMIIVDDEPQGIVYEHNSTITIKKGKVLEIFVENQGRVNYGGKMRDTGKGVLGDVVLDGKVVENWNMIPLMENSVLPSLREALQEVKEEEELGKLVGDLSRPTMVSFIFNTKRQCDTYLKLDMWTKGNVWLNGFNLGRYWTPAGPQRTLYVPRFLLRNVGNELVVFEIDRLPSKITAYVEFVDKPEWTN